MHLQFQRSRPRIRALPCSLSRSCKVSTTPPFLDQRLCRNWFDWSRQRARMPGSAGERPEKEQKMCPAGKPASAAHAREQAARCSASAPALHTRGGWHKKICACCRFVFPADPCSFTGRSPAGPGMRAAYAHAHGYKEQFLISTQSPREGAFSRFPSWSGGVKGGWFNARQ